MARSSKRKVRSPSKRDQVIVRHAKAMYDAIHGVFPGIPDENIASIEKNCRIKLTDELRKKLSYAVGRYCYSRNFDGNAPSGGDVERYLTEFKNAVQHLINYFNMGELGKRERGNAETLAMRKRITYEFWSMQEVESFASVADKISEAYKRHGLSSDVRERPSTLLVGYLMHDLILLEIAAEQALNSFGQEPVADSRSDAALNDLYRDLDQVYIAAEGAKKVAKRRISFFLDVFKLIPAEIRPAPGKDDSIRKRAERIVKKSKTKSA